MLFNCEFKKLKIKNALIFKGEIELPLTNLGIVSVIGKNEDAGGSNGSGKSTLFDILRAIHIGSSSDSPDSLFLSNKGPSYIGYEARYGKNEYDICKYRNDPVFANNTLILKNKGTVGFKKDVRAMKKAISESYVKIPEAIWDNCVVLRTDKAHTLIKGTPSERIDFLSNLCSLNGYDDVHEILKARLEGVNNEIDSLREDEALFADIAKSISESMSKDELENKIRKIKNKIRKIKNKIIEKNETLKKLIDKRNSLQIVVKSINDISKFNVSKTVKELEVSLAKNKNVLEEYRLKLDNAKKQIQLIRDYREALDNLKGISKHDVAKLKRILNKIRTKLDCAMDIRTRSKEKQNLEDKIKNLSRYDLDIEDTEKVISTIDETIFRFNILLQISKRNKYKVCPVCNSSLSKKIKIDSKKLEEDIECSKRKKADLIRQKEKAIELKEAKEKIKKFKSVKNIDEVESDIKILKRKIEKIENNIREGLKYEMYNSQAEKIKTKITISYEDAKKIKVESEEKIKEIEEWVTQFTYIAKKKKEISRICSEYEITEDDTEEELLLISSSIAKKENKIEKFRTTLEKLQNKYGSIKNSLDSIIEKIEKQKKLSAKLECIPKLKKKKEFLTNLVYAYSNKGLKAQKIESILEALKIKLQEYTSILFSERGIDFDIKGDNTKFSIMCVRRDSKGKEVSRYDVRTLSGGEKARFSLAVVFALDDITSPDMKVNFKVLDEIDAKLDDIGKSVLIDQFIPMLRKKTNTLFIISHDKDVRESNIYKHKLYVIKKHDESRIKLVKQQVA